MNKSTSKEGHRWDTEEFEKRTKELNRTELFKLYPSEAWSLYRIIPQCKTVLDLGCGNGAMANIVRQISPETKYTGSDHQGKLMKAASEIFPFANFKAGDILELLSTFPEYDAVMSWSVIKSFQNWREVIANMLQKAEKYVMFDLRVSNVEKEFWDEKICWAMYGNRRGPILVLNYKTLKEALLKYAGELERIEIAAYQSSFDWRTQFSGTPPEQFVVSCVLKKKVKGDKANSDECEVYEQLPAKLQK